MVDRNTDKASIFLHHHNKPGLCLSQNNLPSGGKTGLCEGSESLDSPAQAVTLEGKGFAPDFSPRKLFGDLPGNE
jgi:hypothetical protein